MAFLRCLFSPLHSWSWKPRSGMDLATTKKNLKKTKALKGGHFLYAISNMTFITKIEKYN
jgi:hypothetical protein